MAEPARWDNSTESSIGGGLQILEVSNPSNPRRVGAFDTAGFAASAVAVSGNYAYLSTLPKRSFNVTLSPALLVIDIRNPASPRRVGSIADVTGKIAISGDYVFVLDRDTPVYESTGLLHVVDASDPAKPQRVGAYDISRSSGFVGGVAVSGGNVYVADGSRGLRVLDIVGGPGQPGNASPRQQRTRGPEPARGLEQSA